MKRIVIKIGTNVLADNKGIIDYKIMENLVHDIAEIRKKCKEILIVTSGAIGAGMSELGIEKRPSDVKMQQTCAAVGLSILISKYRELFNQYKIKVAQILLAYRDFTDKKTEINMGNTINTLLNLEVIPIINENDPVSINELGPSFGDNDNLSAMVACRVKADTLIILTNVDGLYDKNPTLKGAKMIHDVRNFDSFIGNLEGASDGLGIGGIKTKIAAAKLAASSGIKTIIANGTKTSVLNDIMSGKKIGTLFHQK